MDTYNKMHDLVRAIKNSEEYKAFKNSKEAIDANPKNKQMLEDFRKKQVKIQAMQIDGDNVPDEKMQQLDNMYKALLSIADISLFLEAEYTFNKLMNDLFKILSDEIAKDLGIE